MSPKQGSNPFCQEKQKEPLIIFPHANHITKCECSKMFYLMSSYFGYLGNLKHEMFDNEFHVLSNLTTLITGEFFKYFTTLKKINTVTNHADPTEEII